MASAFDPAGQPEGLLQLQAGQQAQHYQGQHGTDSTGAASSTVDIWVTLRRRGAAGAAAAGDGNGAAGSTYVLVVKGVDEWFEPGRPSEVNTIWDFLVMQVDRWHAADAPAVAA